MGKERKLRGQKKSRVLAVLLCMILLMQSLCFEALADEIVSIDDEIVDVQGNDGMSLQDALWNGSGTEGDPYQISTAEELKDLADSVNGGTDYEGEYFQLQNDIDLSGKGDNYVVIGYETPSENRPFNGTFDGKGYCIKNIKLNKPNGSYSFDANGGLFGIIGNNGCIENLDVTGEVSGICVGAIAGKNRGIIRNCINHASVSSIPSFPIPDGWNNLHYGKMSPGSTLGGIASTNWGTIEECSNYGDISSGEGEDADVNTAWTRYSGGICGSNGEVDTADGKVSKCRNFGDVSNRVGETVLIECVGSLVGVNVSGTIENSYNVNNTQKNLIKANVSTIKNCYNYCDSGDIYGYTLNELPADIMATVESLTGRTFQDNSNTTDCYALNNSGGKADVNYINTAEFNDRTTFADWDFKKVWIMSTKNKRPILRWTVDGLYSDVQIDGTAKRGEKLSVVATPADFKGEVEYTWYRDGDKIDGATESTYKLTSADIGKKISVEVTQIIDGDRLTQETDETDAVIDSPKLDQDAPKDLTVNPASSERTIDAWIGNVDDTMEYSVDYGKTYISVPEGKTKIEGLGNGIVYVRKKGDEDYNPSEPAKVFIDYIPDIPELVEKTGTTIVLKEVKGWEYSIDDGKTWQSSAKFEGLAMGTKYSIVTRRAETDTTPAGLVSPQLDVTTNKKDVKTVNHVLYEEELGAGIVRTETLVDEDVPESEIRNLDVNLAKKFMTTKELERVNDGATFVMYLEIRVNDEDVPEVDKERAWAALMDELNGVSDNTAIGGYFDLSIYKKIGSDEAIKIENIDGNKIKVTMNVPDDMKGDGKTTRTFFVIRIHGTEADLVGSSTGDAVPFESDKFSTYVLAYSDAVSNPSASQNKVVVVKQKRYIGDLFKKYGEVGYKYRFKVNDKTERKNIKVSKKGVAHAKRIGEATITLYRRTDVKGSAWEQVEEVRLKAEKPVVQKNAGLELGKEYEASDFITEKISVKPTGYISSNINIARVDYQTGHIVPLLKGSVTISAIYGENDKPAKYKTKVKVN